MSASRQAQHLRRRQLSPVDLVQAYISKIEKIDPQLRSYITVCATEALSRAKTLERELITGDLRGPLHGLVYGVKDQLRTKGIRTTLGWRGMKDHIPTYDAAVIERLDRSGAILIGKHNLDQFGKGGTVAWDFGQPRNPWNLEYSPAGSSGGSGAATAAGLCSFALGEDTGGSVRNPAAANGVVGLRPTYGRVSRYGGFMYGWTADTIGPFARTVQDVALTLTAIAGADTRDLLTSTRTVPNYIHSLDRDLSHVRIGIIDNLVEMEAMHPDVYSATKDSIELLESECGYLGHTHLSLARYAVPLLMLTSDADVANGMMDPWLKEHYEEIDYGVRTRLLASAILPSTAYATAMRGRALIRAEILQRLEDFDVLVCPTNAFPAKKIARGKTKYGSAEEVKDNVLPRRQHTYPFSVANVPAVSVPQGYSSEGLPIGLQIVGRPFGEDMVLKVAHAYQEATSWHHEVPPIARHVAGE